MKSLTLVLILCSVFTVSYGKDKEALEKEFKQLPTVPEKDLPEMDNKVSDFRGKIEVSGLKGHTWVSFPFIENPGSFGFDRKGRLYVAEANRFWLGVPDLRGANQMIRDDFKAVTVEDRLKMYKKYEADFPEGWFEKVPDRIIRLEDRDGNGVADHRTLFSDHFKSAADGIGFSVLADEDNTVYFTCIPSVWKITDKDDDGVADSHESIVDGFGVRVSFIGHDLHGITRGPDGMLYFSVGDRSYYLEDSEGKVLNGAGRGAIFRCEDDGTGLELYCDGLRNPQELAFDEFGNLFTFDNTGDIGDKARMVYALQGTDSGWNMAHQSPHHYVSILDWGDFHPEKSMWVAERMFDTHNEEQPQWVYPPAAHVAEGPSGVTYVTGESLPVELRNKFLLSNYRGAPSNSTTLAIGAEKAGAGFKLGEVTTLVKGVAASDVEFGYDGKIYLCDFGGGWKINTNGSIQVIEPVDEKLQKAGKTVADYFKAGFADRPNNELLIFLAHPDKRVRQAAQFALVDNEGGAEILKQAAIGANDLIARIHAVWGMGQLQRISGHLDSELVNLLSDPEEEIRANVVRILGDNRIEEAKDDILECFTKDKSIRVRSLAAVALGRVFPEGDKTAIDALFSAARTNGAKDTDIVLRHAILSGLDSIGSESYAAAKASSDSVEERLLSVLLLRRKESAELSKFLNDPSPLVRREVVRAIYDTGAVDTVAGEQLAGIDPAGFSKTVQRRIMAANYRIGKKASAKTLVKLAGNSDLDMSVRKAALQGLLRWEDTVETDPVIGTYRPVVAKDRKMAAMGLAITPELRKFLAGDHPADLVALAMKLADATGIKTDEKTLITQASDPELDSGVRIAALESLAETGSPASRKLIESLLDDKDAEVQAVALAQTFNSGNNSLKLVERAFDAVIDGREPVARAAIEGLAEKMPEVWATFWELGNMALRPSLKLDGYLAIQKADPEMAKAFAAESADKVFHLSEYGGDPVRGEQIYLNQGACRQCHKIGNDGGVQGPDLTTVANRLNRHQILTSIYNPAAEIAEGYGTAMVSLRDRTSVMGRLAKETDTEVTIIAPDGKERVINRKDIRSVSPPLSAMPPLGATMPPGDLRDLVAYIATLDGKGHQGSDAESHGDPDEAVAK
ncbi:MAG: HEAT repeat domain-containing protein [Verrucomicrobiales bacterium]|nr:HEAT repeat domain-containing protein [Verrucomicrobiales bacterium]